MGNSGGVVIKRARIFGSSGFYLPENPQIRALKFTGKNAKERDLRQLRHRRFNRGLGIIVVLQVPLQVRFVGGHVKVPVPGQVEGDHFFLAGFFALERFVNGDADGVGLFGGGEDAFDTANCRAASNVAVCCTTQGFHIAMINQQRADGRSHPMIAQAAHVDAGGTKLCPSVCILTMGAIIAVSPVIERVLAPCEGRARCGFGGDDRRDFIRS